VRSNVPPRIWVATVPPNAVLAAATAAPCKLVVDAIAREQWRCARLQRTAMAGLCRVQRHDVRARPLLCLLLKSAWVRFTRDEGVSEKLLPELA
jgi:hypothetical protein